VGDGEKLLTYLNSVFKFLLGTDIFPRVPKKKKVKFCCPVKYVNTHIFSHLIWLSQKKTVGDGEKLLTYLKSALKVLSGLDIFSRGTKKKELNFVNRCYLQVQTESLVPQSDLCTCTKLYAMIPPDNSPYIFCPT
jgi:hypothetical protein